jgi:hypothetical protein
MISIMGALDGIRERLASDVVAAVLPRVPDAGSGRHVRAVGFYGLYMDGEQIHLPNLATAVEPVDAVLSRDLLDVDWNPAGWSDDVEYASEELEVAVEAVARMMAPASDAAWNWLERELGELLVRASQEIHDELAGRAGVSPQLVVMYQNQNDDREALVRRTVGEDRFLALFSTEDDHVRERARVAALPVLEQVEYLIGRLNKYGGAIHGADAEQRLVEIGSPAVPALLGLLTDDDRWRRTAQLLARIGDARAAVLAGLRAKVEPGPANHWAPGALALLGDDEWLWGRLPAPEAVAGLCFPYTCARDASVNPRRLDYGLLAALLDHSPEVALIVEDRLGPEQPASEIRPSELDTVLAALEHRHPVVRRHAAWILGPARARDRRVEPALRRRLDDEDPRVRRAAELSLQS